MNKIHFGTDGWRGIIGEDFIFENIRRVAIALAAHLKSEKRTKEPVPVGYDCRFLSEQTAKIFANALLDKKIPVKISKSAVPTPALSYAVKHSGAAVGVMITASHNPFYYNGLKFKLSYGGPAMPVFTKAIEALVPPAAPKLELDELMPPVPEENFLNQYKAAVKKYVDFKLLKKSKLKVIVDSMHGSGLNVISEMLAGTNIKVHSLRNTRDAFFGGGLPEPVLSNLKQASELLKKGGYDLCLATDGDADRIGVLDSKGAFVQLHYLMPILYEYLNKSRGWTGAAVRTTSTDDLFDALVAEYNQQIFEVPVGFKNVCEKTLQYDVLAGGEESGGIYVKKHIPERDGVLVGLLVLEMLENYGMSIDDIVKDIEKRFWKIHYMRADRYSDMKKLKNLMKSMRENPPEKIGKDIISRVSIIDGIKFYFKNGGWLLFRTSDTEPLGRLYCGGRDAASVKRILNSAVKLIFEG